MGLSAQQILQSDPEYLQRQLAAQEQQRVNPTGSAAGALGALLGRGLSNVSQGKGFFQAPDYGLQRVSAVQGIMKSVQFDPNNPAEYYSQVGAELQRQGFSDLAPMAFTEARKLQVQDIDLGIKQARAGREGREAAQKNVKFYKENPDQAEFRIAELAQTLSTDPTNAAALKEYTEITRAASEGAIEAAGKEEKASVDLAKDRAQLAKYRKELADNDKLNPVDKYNNDIQASRDLLKVYGVDPNKPIKDQVKAAVMMAAGSVLLRAQENALLKKTTEGGSPGSAPAATPTAAPAGTVDFNALPR